MCEKKAHTSWLTLAAIASTSALTGSAFSRYDSAPMQLSMFGVFQDPQFCFLQEQKAGQES
jgi:hypothetical protein